MAQTSFFFVFVFYNYLMMVVTDLPASHILQDQYLALYLGPGLVSH
jgi:hypothetical protein